MAAAEPKAAQVKQIGGPAPEQKKMQPLQRGDAALLELSCNTWRVVIKDDVQPGDLECHPNFWNALSEDLHEGDAVKAVWNSGKHVALYEIVNVQHGGVVARLAYAVQGAPVMSATGPKSFPAGYHIEKCRADELPGFVVVREKDGARLMTGGGMPWRSYQDAFEQFPKHAIFASPDATRYTP